MKPWLSSRTTMLAMSVCWRAIGWSSRPRPRNSTTFSGPKNTRMSEGMVERIASRTSVETIELRSSSAFLGRSPL